MDEDRYELCLLSVGLYTSKLQHRTGKGKYIKTKEKLTGTVCVNI